MKAISLHQPWATAVAIGLKKFETRSWSTKYLGVLLVHAAKKRTIEQEVLFYQWLENPVMKLYFREAGILDFDSLPFGKLIAETCVDLVAPTEWLEVDATERLLGDFSPDRYAWRLNDAKRLEQPIPWKGSQGFFEVPDSVLSALQQHLKHHGEDLYHEAKSLRTLAENTLLALGGNGGTSAPARELDPVRVLAEHRRDLLAAKRAKAPSKKEPKQLDLI